MKQQYVFVTREDPNTRSFHVVDAFTFKPLTTTYTIAFAAEVALQRELAGKAQVVFHPVATDHPRLGKCRAGIIIPVEENGSSEESPETQL